MFIIIIYSWSGRKQDMCRLCSQDQRIPSYSCISKSLYIENSLGFNSTLSSVSRKLDFLTQHQVSSLHTKPILKCLRQAELAQWWHNLFWCFTCCGSRTQHHSSLLNFFSALMDSPISSIQCSSHFRVKEELWSLHLNCPNLLRFV